MSEKTFIEISTYRVWLESASSAHQDMLVTLYRAGENLPVAFLQFQAADNLPEPQMTADGNIHIRYHTASYAHILDLLRNESPIYVYYYPVSNGIRAGLSTMAEPVGVGDEDYD